MKQRSSSFSISFQTILLLSFGILPGISQALNFSAFNLKPYVGLEYVQRTLAFKDGYGKGSFNKSLPQGNVFLGLQLNDYLGLEAGYLFSQAATRTTYATQGNQVFGVLIKAGEYAVFESKINLTGPLLNVVGRFPLGTSRFYALGSVGISWLDLKAKKRMIGNDFTAFPTPEEIEVGTYRFASKKVVQRILAGIGYQFTEFFGGRIQLGYETTSRFKDIKTKETSGSSISLKNNTLCSIGVTAHF